MEITQISAEQRGKILGLEEGHFGDLKGKDIKPAKLTITVSALANASGGEIYVGIDEKNKKKKIREWRGFESIEESNAHLAVVEKLAPLANHYEATFLSCDGEDGLVLQLQIFKSKDIISSSDGAVYIRRGAQNLIVDGDEALARLKLDKGIRSFEDETLNSDVEEISNSEIIIGFLLSVVPTAEPEPWLIKQKLVVEGMPTVAGTLLFSEDPQASLPKRSAVKIYRYKTKDEEGDREGDHHHRLRRRIIESVGGLHAAEDCGTIKDTTHGKNTRNDHRRLQWARRRLRAPTGGAEVQFDPHRPPAGQARGSGTRSCERPRRERGHRSGRPVDGGGHREGRRAHPRGANAGPVDQQRRL